MFVLYLTFILGFELVFGESCTPVDDTSFLFVRGNLNDTKEITLDNTASLLTDPLFKASKSTVIYCYGYTESFESPSTQVMTQAYLARGDHNILIINWKKYATGNYFLDAVPNALKVGELFGKGIAKMSEKGFDIKKFHLVGHSLGAHIVGHAARVALQSSVKIPWITGLDPSGPGFFPLNPFLPALSKLDGEFVDIIHTNSVLLGANASTGHADFLPNGGEVQPGCPPFDDKNIFKIENFCNHARSWMYYAESLTKPEKSNAFRAISCPSWGYFLFGLCGIKKTNNMGHYVDHKLTGNFYLLTNSKPSFSRGAKEIYK